jgi:TetR/AcrR family transcriptional repressor of nem operon
VGRPREFDEDAVVDAAREAFWSRGVHATSITDLSEATGLSVGSLYKAFGSKGELCARTLDTYLQAGLERVEAILTGAASPLAGLQGWLEWIAERASSAGPTRGCYAVVCTSELAQTDASIRARLVAHDERLRGLVAAAIAAANRGGELSGDPQRGARLLCTTVNGVQLDGRKGISRDDARATLMLALDALR